MSHFSGDLLSLSVCVELTGSRASDPPRIFAPIEYKHLFHYVTGRPFTTRINRHSEPYPQVPVNITGLQDSVRSAFVVLLSALWA